MLTNSPPEKVFSLLFADSRTKVGDFLSPAAAKTVMGIIIPAQKTAAIKSR